MKRQHFAAAFALALAVLGSTAQQAAADRNPKSPILGYVVAHSHDGNGSIRAPYRATPVGYQVRLPHGTWVYCRTSCSETLRVQTVDIWANVDSASPIGVGTVQNECGIAGCLHWEWNF